MPESKQDPMKWLKQVADLNAYLNGRYTAPRPELKEALKLSDSQITDLLNLKNCFDQPAIDKVRKAAKGKPGFALSSRSALALAELRGRVDDFRRVFHEALDVVLTHRLATLKTTGLVNHILSGKPAKDFDPSQVKRKTRSDKKSRIQSNGPVSEPKMKEAKGNQQDSPKDAIFGCLTCLFLIWLFFPVVGSCVKHLCCNSKASSEAASTPVVGSSNPGK